MRTLLISYYSNPNSNLIERAKNSGIKTLTFIPHALRVVSCTTLLGLHGPFSIPNLYLKHKEMHFGCALGLEKGPHNPNRVACVTVSKACEKTFL